MELLVKLVNIVNEVVVSLTVHRIVDRKEISFTQKGVSSMRFTRMHDFKYIVNEN